MRIKANYYLHMKLWDLAQFPEFNSSGFSKNSQSIRAKSMTSFPGPLFLLSEPKLRSAPRKHVTRVPNFLRTNQQRVWGEECLSALVGHLISFHCAQQFLLFSRIPGFFFFHPTKKSVERAEDAALFSSSAQKRYLDLPLSESARGREDATGPRRIFAPMRASCLAQTWQAH